MRRRILSMASAAMLLLAVAAGSALAGQGAADHSKVAICHINGNGTAIAITVSANAVPAHMAHGDALPDGYGACN